MPRPNRLYTIDGKYYYIKDGKKVFVKVPAGVSQKQVSKINIKNIIKLAESKRVVRKKKRRNLSYQKKIAPVLQKSETGGLPIYFFKPSKNIPTLEEQAKASDDTNVEKLAKLLLKDAKLTPSSSKLPTEPTIATPQKKPSAFQRMFSSSKKAAPTQPEPASPAPEPPAKRTYKNRISTLIAGFKTKEKKLPDKEQVRGMLLEEGRDVATPRIESALKSIKIDRPGVFSPLGKMGSLEEEKIGEGYGGSDGLYDDEIETIAKKRLKDYIPCIAKDETNELMKYVKKGDKQFGFVINTDEKNLPGRHWRCVYINNMDDYPSIEYFDPLTEGKPEQSLIDICRKIAIKMNPSKLFKYKQNMIRRQSKLTSNCGYHCIHFLEGRYQGIPFSEITGYDDFVNKMKGQQGDLDGSGQGEIEIKPFMKKYDSYI